MANVTNTGITISTTSNLSSGQAIMIEEAKRAFEPDAPDPSLVSVSALPSGHKQADILTYARLADADALTEGVDYTSVQQLYANYLSINPTEHGVIVTLSKRAMRRQPESLEAMAGTMQGIALRAREAKDVIALYSGFSKDVGAAGNTLDISVFRGSVAYLMTDNDTEFGPTPMPIHGVFHAENISDIVSDLSDVAVRREETAPSNLSPTGFRGDAMSESLLQRWWRGSDRAYGVQVFHAGYITRDSGDDAIGSIKNMDALHLVMEGETDDATEEDVSHRLTEFGIFKSWGEAERADPHGVAGTFDAAATV